MEATCQYVELHVAIDLGIPSNATVVCGAPIPRLCLWCKTPEAIHISEAGYERYEHSFTPGPLASECANGHPVAVRTEEVSDALAG